MRFKEFFLLQEQVPPGKTYYHVCKDTNLPNILKMGLLVSQGDRSSQMEEEPSVFLFRDKNSAYDAISNWLGDEFEEDEILDLLQISLPSDFPLTDDPRMFEVVSKRDIPPSFIRLLKKGI